MSSSRGRSTAVLQARYPADLRIVGRALGVNMSAAAVRGVLQAICDAAGISGHDALSHDLEIALLSTLRSRRDELASELDELTEYISRIENARKQQVAEQQIEVQRQQEQAATFEAIRAAKEAFDAALENLSDADLSPLLDALKGDDGFDAVTAAADNLISRHALPTPSGADPVQWLVDHLVAMRGSA